MTVVLVPHLLVVQGEFRGVRIIETDVVLAIDGADDSATEGTYVPLDNTENKDNDA